MSLQVSTIRKFVLVVIATFTASVVGGSGTPVFQWQLDNAGSWTNVGTDSSIYATLALTGVYDYRVIISQNNGCGDTSNVVTLTVFDDPTVNVTLNDATICVGGTTVLTANVTGGTSAVTFQWQSSPDNAVWTNVAVQQQILLSLIVAPLV